MVNLRDIETELRTYQAQLESFGVSRLHLLGSTVRGQTDVGSDLDFLVELHPKTFRNYTNFKLFLEDLFEQPVDLVTPKSLKPALRDRVTSETCRVI